MGYNLTEITNKNLPTQITDSVPLGDLVKVPFRTTNFMQVDGTLTYQANINNGTITDNDDGTSSGLYVSATYVTSGTGSSYAASTIRIRFPFYGRVLGLRLRRPASSVSVSIDGVCYGLLSLSHPYFDAEGLSIYDEMGSYIVDNNLMDGGHVCELIMPMPASGTSFTQFFGFLAEKKAGYSDHTRELFIYSTKALSTTAIEPDGGTSSSFGGRGFKQIFYTNTTASPITVTIYNNTVQMWQKSIGANDTQAFDFGQLTGIQGFGANGHITHVASATGINATVIGGE